jgi:predicted dehydrogenase
MEATVMIDSLNVNLPIRIVLCGLGVWGRNWFENIIKNKDYELVGVVESNTDTLNKVKASSRLDDNQCFTDITQAIESIKPDAVAVVVSPDKHGEIIRVAIEKNVHILSEKPLAKDISEAREFMALHRRHPNVRFIVNQNYRGRNCIATMRKLIEDGVIGEVGYFIYNHQQTVKIPGYRLEMPSPVLDDMIIHHFDMMRFLTNQDFEEIYAKEESVKWSWFKGKPIVYLNVNMTNSVSGIYCGSWASEGKIGGWNGNIQVFGSEGCIELTDDARVILHEKHNVNEDLLGTYQPGQEVKQFSIEYSELQYTLENFKNALTRNLKCETDIEDNIRSFVAVLAAKESIAQNRPITIASLDVS